MAPVSGDEDEDIAAPGDPDDVDDVTGDEVAAARDASGGGHAEDVDDIANDQDPEDYNGNSHRAEVRKSAEIGMVTDNFFSRKH